MQDPVFKAHRASRPQFQHSATAVPASKLGEILERMAAHDRSIAAQPDADDPNAVQKLGALRALMNDADPLIAEVQRKSLSHIEKWRAAILDHIAATNGEDDATLRALLQELDSTQAQLARLDLRLTELS